MPRRTPPPSQAHRAVGTLLLGATLAIAASAPSTPLGAQQTASAVAASDSSNPATSRPAMQMFTARDAALAAGFIGATFALLPFDRTVARQLQDPAAQTNQLFRHATGVEWIASPGAYMIGGSLYAIGRLGNMDRLADLGWHGVEAILVADGTTRLLKGLLGRARPYVSGATDPEDWDMGSGFSHGSPRQSFPSGHTSTAFAAAAAVTTEMSHIKPGSAKIVGPILYGGATLVGLSRMYNNKHWASDVALGAAIGTFAGQKVVRVMHSRPGNLIDRIMLGAHVAPDPGGGVRLGWSATH